MNSAPGASGSKRGRKIATSLVIVIGLVVYIWFFGFQTATAIMVRWSLRKMPFEKAVPSTLALTPVSQVRGVPLQYLGYTFDVPWNDLDTEAIRVDKTRVTFPFRSGLQLSFYSMSDHEVVDTLVDSTGVKAEAIRALYGVGSTRPDYDLVRRVLYTTPRDVTPFISQKASAVGMMLLVIKGMYVPETSGMYEVTTGEFRGFQYGNLSKHPSRLVVDLWLPKRGIEFVFWRKDHLPLDLSQADINRVIQTLSYSSPQTSGSQALFRLTMPTE